MVLAWRIFLEIGRPSSVPFFRNERNMKKNVEMVQRKESADADFRFIRHNLCVILRLTTACKNGVSDDEILMC